MTDTSKEAPARLWAMKTAGNNWKEPLATPHKVDHFQSYVREDLYVEAIAERDALRAQLQAARDAKARLPWREKDIQRGLILFRTSSNAHGYTNYSALSGKIDALPQAARDELAAIMVNMALGYSRDDVNANGVIQQWIEAARDEALGEAISICERGDILTADSAAAHLRQIRALKSTSAEGEG